jgi:hypothetical protein
MLVNLETVCEVYFVSIFLKRCWPSVQISANVRYESATVTRRMCSADLQTRTELAPDAEVDARLQIGPVSRTVVQTDPGAELASSTMCTEVSFPGLKRPGRVVNHPPASSAEVKEGV